MLQGSSRGERLARGLKNSAISYRYYSRSWQELLVFLSLGERVAACGDGAWASVRRSDRGSESSYGLSSFRGGDFLRIDFANDSDFPFADGLSSLGGACRSCRSSGSWSQSMRSDGARASVRRGPRQWKQPPGWITAEDREVLPLSPFVPIAFWH
jgi:hypothetical protein